MRPNLSRMKRSKSFIISSLGLVLALTLSWVFDMFTNGDFETRSKNTRIFECQRSSKVLPQIELFDRKL
jgi:hypothetical protein